MEKVILNLGPLGGAFKTGVYRVSEHLARGLAKRFGSTISFHPVTQSFSSTEYYHRHLATTGARFLIAEKGKYLLPISRILSSFVSNSHKNRSFCFKLARYLAVQVMVKVDSICSRIPADELAGTTVYHSSFWPIPKQIRQQAQISRFTTIYDLIPITNPEYFEPSTIKLIRAVVDNLDSEDYTMSISKATRETLLQHSSCDPEKALVIPLAASEHFFPITDPAEKREILARYQIPETDYILSLCTFEVRKNLEILIRAYAALRRKGTLSKDVKLVLVGGKGWKTRNLEEALSSAVEFKDDIIMPGFVPDEDLAAVYSSARVFVYMSFLEGFGLPPLEAMQCGTPVITSNTSSLPEVVGDAGTMLDPNDLEGLCESITRHYENDAFREEMSAKALERAKLFSWKRFIDETLWAYRRTTDS